MKVVKHVHTQSAEEAFRWLIITYDENVVKQ